LKINVSIPVFEITIFFSGVESHKEEDIFGFVPLGGSGSGFLICGVPFQQILFQISYLSNPLWTRIRRVTDLSDPGAFLWVKDPKLITVRSGFADKLHMYFIYENHFRVRSTAFVLW